MKIVNNNKELQEALQDAKEGEEILFYERELKSQEGFMKYQKYLSRLIMMGRANDIKIKGCISFVKNAKGEQK